MPVDGRNVEAIKASEKNIKEIIKVDQVYSFTTSDGNFLHWVFPATEAEVGMIQADEGIAEVVLNEDEVQE